MAGDTALLGLSGSTSAEEVLTAPVNARGRGRGGRPERWLASLRASAPRAGREGRVRETALSRFPGLWLPEGVCGRG